MTMGIYKITCTQNNNCFIGSSTNIETSLKLIKSDLILGTYKNEIFQADFEFFEGKGFTAKTLEIITDSNKLQEREDYYIIQYKSDTKGYNEHKVIMSQPPATLKGSGL